MVAQTVKNLAVMQETRVQSLGREDSLEKEMATRPVLLPREFYEEPGELKPMWSQRVRHD